MRLLVVFCCQLLALQAAGTTYFVRTDGGDPVRCTGTADAPDPGSGTGMACAWDHPFRALPPVGPLRLAGGDTLVVGPGSYRMGYGAPGDDGCDAAGSFECHLPPLPDGLDAMHPTRILGAGWDQGCPSPPELWGAERPWQILDLTATDHAEVACLELTDRSDCIEFHADPGIACERDSPPYGDWASAGIAAADSTGVRLADLDVHGLAAAGIHAGRLTDWTVERVRIAGNGWVGWDGDLGGPSSNSGDLTFRDVEVAWNGCGEDWQLDTVVTESCWAQQLGGYGDGIGLADTEGRWLLEDVRVHHNTSDGIDLLYLVGSSSLEARRVRSWGNAGNPFKASGDVVLENSLLVADCAFFDGLPHMTGGDHCRAGGNALALALYAGSTVTVTNTTITGEGDCLMEIECRDGSCDGSESVTVRNALFTGGPDWTQPGDETCLYWWDDGSLPADPADFDYGLFFEVKGDPCPGAHSVCGLDPELVDRRLDTFDGHLTPGSPAVDAGTPAAAPATDLDGTPRDAMPDVGAYELGGVIFRDGFESGGTAAWSTPIWQPPS